LMLEAISSETSVNIYWTTRRHTPGDNILRSHHVKIPSPTSEQTEGQEYETLRETVESVRRWPLARATAFKREFIDPWFCQYIYMASCGSQNFICLRRGGSIQ
jgi:hypothetical protein